MDKKQIYDQLISPIYIQEEHEQIYNEYINKLKQVERKCHKQIELFLAFLGFERREGFFDEWIRTREDGVTEVIEIGKEYFGIFFNGDYKYNEVKELSYNLRGDGVTTISSNGVGAKREDMSCLEILEFLYDWFQNEFDRIEEEITS